MSFLKVTAVLGIVLVVAISYVSSMDFSIMNMARSTMMAHARGTQRTVQVLKPNLKVVPGRPKKPKVVNRRFGSSRRRRRYSLKKTKPTTKLTFVRQTKTYKARKTPSNKFLEALTAIERGVADANAAKRWLKYSRPKLNALKTTISLAARKRMYQFSRHRLGEAFFLLQNSRSSRRTTRSTKSNQASSFVNDLKQTMGATQFDEFMAVMGDVTLMFAIDTTGSMANDINAAKRIAVDVINYPRQNPVSYILSPFNDPGTGPLTFKPSTEGALFVDAINKLSAGGGGDCAELTIKGILDALYEGPDWGSPLYVFTDASAKDASAQNMEDVKSMAQYVGATINFFTTGTTCFSNVFGPFQELADATSGQVLSLSNHLELLKLTGFTGSVLGGSNVISSGSNMSNRKKRRAAGVHRYSIKVDDSIEKMSVSVTTTRSNQGSAISLINPRGATVTSGKVSMSKVSVYEVAKPNVGSWSLVIPASVGEHSYFIKSTSDSNIDFEYYFTHSIRRPATEVPIANPLIGRQTKVIITLAGYHKVQKNTVVLELVTKHGEHIRDVTLQPDNQGMRYKATFTPPSRPFKLKIKGTTKASNSFERVSRNIIEPKHVLLRVLRSDKDFTLRRGQRTRVTFHLFNSANVNKLVDIVVKDRLGYAAPVRRSRRTVRSGKWGFFSVDFNTPPNAAIENSDTAIVSISVQNGAERTSLPVQLIVVA